MTAPAVDVQGIRFRYGGPEVLRGVDLTVAWGSVTGLLGPNGAGKTTTLKHLVGLIRPETGSVRIAGLDPAGDDIQARATLGYVPEDGGLYPLLSAAEQIALCCDLHEVPPEGEARVEELVEALDLKPLLNRRIDTLSKGQRQRVAIAAGLLHGPTLWLLDEPLSGLDATAAGGLRDLVAQHARDGGAVLYCSHVLDVVERVCNEVTILAEGQVLASGTVDEVTASADASTLDEAFRSLVGTARAS